MDRQELMNLASRIAHAPSYEARIGELFRAAPESMLNRYGLAHQTSWASSFLAITGAFALGAGIGAGTALLFAPSSGNELRGKLRPRARRISDNVKDAQHRAEEKVVNARERVMSRAQDYTTGDTGSDAQSVRNTGY
jgi:gas vesicle protein